MFTWVFQELNFKYIFKLWVYKQTREPPADAAARLVYSEVLTPPIFLWWWRQAGWREGSSKATWRTPGDLRRKRHQRTRASLQTWRSADIISQGKQTYKYYNHKSWNQDSWLVISSLILYKTPACSSSYTELSSILPYTTPLFCLPIFLVLFFHIYRNLHCFIFSFNQIKPLELFAILRAFFYMMIYCLSFRFLLTGFVSFLVCV